MAGNDSIASKQAKFGATAGLYTVIVIAILAAVNYLGVRFNRPVDLTSNKRFTLSGETQKMISSLKSNAKITYFDVPRNFEQARGLLDRYKNLSSKVHIQYVNPRSENTLAREYGLRYQGTAFVEVDSRREEAKTFDEQGITGAFLKISKGVRKVCVVSGGKEHSLDQSDGQGLSAFKALLERDNYLPEAITLLDKGKVPEDCKVVLIAGPKSEYPATQVSALKAYVENGGRAMFLLDPPLDFRAEHISENKGLTDLLASWGVAFDKDLVLEETPLAAIYGPQYPPVNRYESHPIVNDLRGSYTIMPIVRSMQVKSEGKSTATKLFSTSDRAVAATNLSNPTVKMDDPSYKKGPFILGAAGNYDTGKPNEGGRFVAIGTSGFLANDTIATASNRDLALNAVNWLSSDEDLISIRPKEPEDRRLEASKLGVFQFWDMWGFPILVIAAGIAVFMKRR